MVLCCLVPTLLVAAAPDGLAAEGCKGQGTGSTKSTAAPPDASAGLKVYLDPDTGELLAEPPPGVASGSSPETPAAEPDVRFAQQPDGTVVADVGDRFMTELYIEIVDGKAVTCHRPVTASDANPPTAREGERDGEDH